ncbi:Redoxin [Fistulina hepatica ATCC 64428]|uniref:Redoxin n=1 Tax=Fistulina hepatica ATCC 64428 TaxID=1128425 RepID=A0A0D7AKZ3_9AGAR|nr:Redoxin [Fistulina hepatica ATCC 64428]
MTSLIGSTAQAAHSAFSALISTAEVHRGSEIKTLTPQVKEGAADTPVNLNFAEGRRVIVGVPGAFTGTCSKQIPTYISLYDQFKARGVSEILVVAVNDAFVMQAWKEKLAPEGTPVRFIADDQGLFVSSLGLVFDATPLLGGPRSKRFVIVADGPKVTTIAVEKDPGQLTSTDAHAVLSLL